MSIMCSLSPFAMSFLVPAFPSMAVEFSKPVADIQLLISVFIIGLGLAQPVHGLLADRYGRRPVLLSGFAIFIVASAASFLTSSWVALVVCRFFQAVGVSAGTVASRAIVNDVQSREESAVTLSYISIAMGVGPIIAPTVGGFLDVAFGWRSIFLGCTLAGIIIWALAVIRLPETRSRNIARQSKSLFNIVSDYKILLSSSQFIGYTLMFGFGQGVFFAFLPFAPDYFENVLGESRSVFIICWFAMSLAFMAGSLLGTRLTRHIGMDKAIFFASVWLVGTAMIVMLSYLLFGGGAIAVTVPLMLAMLGVGLISPLALAGSISFKPELAATAAGLSSSLGLILGGLFAVVSGHLYDQTLLPYIALATIAIAGNLFSVWLTRRVRKTTISGN